MSTYMTKYMNLVEKMIVKLIIASSFVSGMWPHCVILALARLHFPTSVECLASIYLSIYKK